jgi:hypothetical protein
MAAEYPIPKELIDAFGKAASALYQWNDLDAVITYERKGYSLGEIADLAAVFDDTIPEGIFYFLCHYAPQFSSPGDKRTFSTAAPTLRAEYDKSIKRRG